MGRSCQILPASAIVPAVASEVGMVGCNAHRSTAQAGALLNIPFISRPRAYDRLRVLIASTKERSIGIPGISALSDNEPKGIGTSVEDWLSAIGERNVHVGVIGLGYVGLPLAVAALRSGFRVTGFDVNESHVERLAAGQSSIGRVTGEEVMEFCQSGCFRPTTQWDDMRGCDAVIICVPTPLDKHREPDLSYVEGTSRLIAGTLRPGQLVVLESTTYPGTTTGVVRPILEETGLSSGRDFFLAFSPEREDPGNQQFETSTIAKIVGGDGPEATEVATALYGAIVRKVVPVSSSEVAEATKLMENIFRAVNIALVNELKIIYGRMGIDIWEVIEAAKTKPFGYMPFYPGPGLGGHCIPIDPFYLTWKAREFDVSTRFIELAGEVNTRAPYHVIESLVEALSTRKQKAVAGSRILLFGLAYKKNVEDVRESPAFTLIKLLEERGAKVDFHDPFVPEVPMTREHMELAGRRSVNFDPAVLQSYDAGLICTDHSNVDYAGIVASMDLVIDTRNATKDIIDRSNVVLA